MAVVNLKNTSGGGSWGDEPSNVVWRENIKNNYPWVYENILGGQRADEYHKDNLKFYNTVTAVADNGFDIIVWFRQNWQLAILGLVALLVLLKS